MVFIFGKIISYINHFHFKNLQEKQENLFYYRDIQNNFCDNFRNVFNKDLEREIILYNISLNKQSFDIFMYNNSEIINTIILSNKSLEEEVSLNILNVLKHYTDKHNYKNEDVMIIVIGANVVWYTTLLGVFKYSVLTFESFPDNYYILKKNFCRNHKNFFNPESTITIVNKTIYPIETFCDYYKDLKNRKKDFILCDKTKEKNLDKD